MFGIFSDISYFCSLLQNIVEYYRVLQNIRRLIMARMIKEMVVQDCPIRNILSARLRQVVATGNLHPEKSSGWSPPV